MRKELRRKILKITFEILATPVDLILFTLLVGIAGTKGDYTMRGMIHRLDKLVDQGQDRIIRNAVYRAKKEHWIKKDLKLTKEGRERIFNLIPQFLPLKQWDGNWYLASFDIPEKMRYKRDILRENLKRLGFRPLHASCWISAINYLPNVEEITNFYGLHSYVILAKTDKLGKEDSKALANRVWKLDEINRRYFKFISKWEKASPEEKFWLQFEYLNILRDDPQLPKELLPNNWQAGRAYQLGKQSIKISKTFLK